MGRPAKPNPELSKIVHVKADVVTMWDGREYDLKKGANIAYGAVQLWQDMFPTVEFTIEEVAKTPIGSREVPNPLGIGEVEEAFSGLKRGRKPKEG